MNYVRRCARCKKPYLRSNRVRLWVVTNMGHRLGWQKVEEVVCCRCMEANDAQQVLREVNPRYVRVKWSRPRKEK